MTAHRCLNRWRVHVVFGSDGSARVVCDECLERFVDHEVFWAYCPVPSDCPTARAEAAA